MARLRDKIKNYAELVMFSHSLFSLPFGLLGAFWAVESRADGVKIDTLFIKLFLCVVALLCARVGANAFNRYADREIDAKNPRTRTRPIQRGDVRPRDALIIAAACFAGLALCAALLNTLCLILLPLAIALFVLYSYTKRFTWACHFVLGLCCGGAPVGAWIAVTGGLALEPFILGGAVTFWVAGFDINYARADIGFDRENRLHSVPARFGDKWAVYISLGCQIVSFGLMCSLSRGYTYIIGLALIAVMIALNFIFPIRGKKLPLAAYGISPAVSTVLLFFGGADMIMRRINYETDFGFVVWRVVLDWVLGLFKG